MGDTIMGIIITIENKLRIVINKKLLALLWEYIYWYNSIVAGFLVIYFINIIAIR